MVTTVAPSQRLAPGSQEKLTYQHSRGLELARLAYGAVQLWAPAAAARTIGGQTDADSLQVRRVLGARHLVQAFLLLNAPRGPHLLGSAVDFAHAATAFAWAGVDPKRRGDAVLNGVIDVLFAWGELR
jgi:hypothetical protein